MEFYSVLGKPKNLATRTVFTNKKTPSLLHYTDGRCRDQHKDAFTGKKVPFHAGFTGRDPGRSSKIIQQYSSTLCIYNRNII